MNETASRIISGIGIGLLAVAALTFDHFYWIFPLVLIMGFALLGLLEYYTLADRGFEGRPIRWIGIVIGILIVLTFYAQFLQLQTAKGTQLNSAYRGFTWLFYPGMNLTPLFFLLLFMLTMSLQMVLRPLDGSIYSIAVTIFGVLYAVLPFAHLFLLFALKYGTFYIIFFALGPIAADTGAYFSGRWFGKHNAGLKVSPKKTYEGYIGGIIFCMIVLVGYTIGWNYFTKGTSLANVPMGLVEAAILAFFLSIVSIFGDLVESAMKRDARIKDSASVIPGHGGILDLVDAMIFAFPLGYYYLFFKQHMGFTI